MAPSDARVALSSRSWREQVKGKGGEAIMRRGVLCLVLVALAASGCSQGPGQVSEQAAFSEQKVFDLKEITPERGKALLSELGLGTACVLPGRNAVSVTGSASDLYRAAVLLDLVDTRGEFLIETLAPVSEARIVPMNAQIAEAFGNVAIGTFANPPQAGERMRAIIDIHGESVVAIIPARIHRELVAFVKVGPEGLRQVRDDNRHAETAAVTAERPAAKTQEQTEPQEAKTIDARPNVLPAPVVPDQPKPDTETTATTPAPMPSQAATDVTAKPKAITAVDLPAEPVVQPHEELLETRGTIAIEAPGRSTGPAKTSVSYEPVLPDNAENVLQLDLPDRLEMIQLLDLVAEYLRLDYMYEPEKIKGQAVSLRLHGKLQGEVRVKDLYPLLESVLKFKGFAMTCHKGNLVTIVPVTDALQVDPTLVDSDDPSIEAGDMVVTRVFGLQYMNAASAMNLLDSMKLSVATSPIEETRSLIVTCYAYRMARIERLLSMVDRPGRPKEFRFRQLKYTMAATLAKKVETLVTELQTMPVKVAPMEQKPSLPALTVSAPTSPVLARSRTVETAASDSTEKQTVYLDADERTNRILMIGHVEQLAIVEKVVDALDVAQHDPRSLEVYAVMHLSAADAKKKLEELEVIGKSKQAGSAAPAVFISKTSSDKPGGADGMGQAAMEETQVTVLEATNSLLINATQEQHARIATVLRRVDVVQQDLRTFKTYEIKHVDAEEVKKQLSAFQLIVAEGKSKEKPAAAATAAATPAVAGGGASGEESATMQEPQVSVLESTNSLLVNATEFQHARIAAVVQHVDAVARDEAIPYEIYFLENQDPEHLAQVLQKILFESVRDKEAKTETVIRKIDEEIMIVPDKDTFSVIVYASKKNQEWISKLIKTLDKRRPQVLIDATLVEIRKNDEFNYDLDLVASLPDLTQTGGQTQQFMYDENTTVTERLQQSGRDRFTDFQVKSGEGVGFYADEHIQVLLEAVQTKNYGRVLAKPKVLVNDNEKGTIKTADTTYVATKSSIPVTSGAAGQQNQLIETAVKYESCEAGITLEITPHISEGDLLRLEVMLTRADFTGTAVEKPPNQTSSNVTTVVTVPDGSTIILGGMLKLNQNKGGSKVPILGDLPLVGGVFRSINNSDVQSMLYIFVRAEIIRPAEALANGDEDLRRISDQNSDAFEKHEHEFQSYQTWPGIKPKPMPPAKVLEAR
jgi:type II secretory pathway component GspD/PulD (secretin)